MANAPKESRLGPTVLLFSLTLLAYAPALHCDFIWDDDDHVEENATLRTVDGLRRIWTDPRSTPQYYPLVHTTFWLEYHLWEQWPNGYHLNNVLLHALGSVLLWRLLARLGVPAALPAAALFALHPVHVESVAWITERKNVLSSALYLAAMLAYLRFAPPETGATIPDKRRRFYLAAVVLFVCALLSKTVTASMPAAVLLLLWWKRGRLSWRDVRPLAPMFLIGAALGMRTVFLERARVGAEGFFWDVSFAERCLIAGRALWFYAAKLIWPHPLVFIYRRWEIDTALWWQYLFPLSAMVLVVVLWFLRRRLGRGPLTAALYFGGTLFPALGFFNVYPMRYSYVADHFQYLASLGPIVLLVTVAAAFLSRRAWRRFQWPVTAIVFVLLGGLCWKQTHIYANRSVLWQDTLTKNPGASIAYNELGVDALEQKEMDVALDYFKMAVAAQPTNVEAIYNLGTMRLNQGDLAQAADQFDQILAIMPNYVEAHTGRGVVFAKQGDFAQAQRHLERALSINQNHPEVHYNLGVVLYEKGEFTVAADHFAHALRLRPTMVKARDYLGRARQRGEESRQ